MLKEILSPREINRLAACRYNGEHRDLQRAFIFCCFFGMRFCEACALTYEDIDYECMVMRFNQKKGAGRSAHAAVTIPMKEELLRLLGEPDDGNYSRNI